MALLGFLEIPKKGQIPKKLDKITFETNKLPITIAIISPIVLTSYALLAASFKALALAAFLFSADSLIALNTATAIPSTKNAPAG